MTALTREEVAAGAREAVARNAHRELALVIAALEIDRCLPPYALHSLRRVEFMLRPDTIDELAERLQGRVETEAVRCR